MMEGIPWQYLGAGAIGIAALAVVLNFLLKWKSNSSNRPLCVNSPEVKDALADNRVMAKSIERVEKHIEKIKEDSFAQTGYLKQLVKLQENTHKTLKEIAKNGKKG